MISSPYALAAPLNFHRSIARGCVSNYLGSTCTLQPNSQIPLKLSSSTSSPSTSLSYPSITTSPPFSLATSDSQPDLLSSQPPRSSTLAPCVLIIDSRCLPGAEGGAVVIDGKIAGMLTLPLCQVSHPARISSSLSSSIRSTSSTLSSSTPTSASIAPQTTPDTNIIPHIDTIGPLLSAPGFTAHINIAISSDALVAWMCSLEHCLFTRLQSQPHRANTGEDRESRSTTSYKQEHMEFPSSDIKEGLKYRGQNTQMGNSPLYSNHVSASTPYHHHHPPFHPYPLTLSPKFPSYISLSRVNPIALEMADRSLVLVRLRSSWATGIIVSRTGYIITSAHLIVPHAHRLETDITTINSLSSPLHSPKLVGPSEQTDDAVTIQGDDAASKGTRRETMRRWKVNGTIMVRIERKNIVTDGHEANYYRNKHNSGLLTNSFTGVSSAPSTTHWVDASLIYLSIGSVDVALLKINTSIDTMDPLLSFNRRPQRSLTAASHSSLPPASSTLSSPRSTSTVDSVSLKSISISLASNGHLPPPVTTPVAMIGHGLFSPPNVSSPILDRSPSVFYCIISYYQPSQRTIYCFLLYCWTRT